MNTYNPLPKNLRILSVIVGLVLFIFLLGASSVNSFPIFSQVNRITGVLLIILSIPFFWIYFQIPKEAWLYGGFILWSFISGLIVSKDSSLLLADVRLLVQLFPLFLTIINLGWIFRGARLNFRIVAVITTIVAYYGLTTGNFLGVMLGEVRQQFGSLMTNPNEFGVILCFGSVSILFFWNKASLMQRLLLIVLIVLFIGGIILSGSRKSFLAFLVLIGCWMWFCYQNVLKQRPAMVIFAITVLLGIWFLINYVIQNTFLGFRLLVAWQDPETGQSRIRLYQQAINTFISHPIAGVGLGNFVLFSTTGQYAHSDYGEVLAGTGLFGAIFYFSMYIVFWLRLNRLDRMVSEPGISYALNIFKATLIMLLFIGFAQPNYNGVFKMLILATMIGYAVALERQIKNKNKTRFQPPAPEYPRALRE